MGNSIFLDSHLFFFFLNQGKNFSNIWKALNTLNKTFVVNVKTLQEIVYYYHVIGETKMGYENAKLVRDNCSVFSVTDLDIKRQNHLLKLYPKISPRELFHAANMLNNNITHIANSPKSTVQQIEELTTVRLVGKIQDKILS